MGTSRGVGKELWGASTFNVRSRTDLMSGQGQRTSVQRSWKRAGLNKPMEPTFQERERSDDTCGLAARRAMAAAVTAVHRGEWGGVRVGVE